MQTIDYKLKLLIYSIIERSVVIVGKSNSNHLTIDNFPKKELTVADLLHYVDKKEYLMICDTDLNRLFCERAEYLLWAEEGCLHALALRTVNWFERGTDCIIIYVNDDPETQDN